MGPFTAAVDAEQQQDGGPGDCKPSPHDVAQAVTAAAPPANDRGARSRGPRAKVPENRNINDRLMENANSPASVEGMLPP